MSAVVSNMFENWLQDFVSFGNTWYTWGYYTLGLRIVFIVEYVDSFLGAWHDSRCPSGLHKWCLKYFKFIVSYQWGERETERERENLACSYVPTMAHVCMYMYKLNYSGLCQECIEAHYYGFWGPTLDQLISYIIISIEIFVPFKMQQLRNKHCLPHFNPPPPKK